MSYSKQRGQGKIGIITTEFGITSDWYYQKACTLSHIIEGS